MANFLKGKDMSDEIKKSQLSTEGHSLKHKLPLQSSGDNSPTTPTAPTTPSKPNNDGKAQPNDKPNDKPKQ